MRREMIMANAEYLVPHILRWEGGCACLDGDSGGWTCSGITIGTFRYYYGQHKTVTDLKNMTPKQWMYIFKLGFWNPCKADFIENQSLANLIVDSCWLSGTKSTIKKVQKAIGVEADGIVGKKTLGMLNKYPEDCFYKIRNMRISFYDSIIEKNPLLKRFKKGWLNRLNAITYLPTERTSI